MIRELIDYARSEFRQGGFSPTRTMTDLLSTLDSEDLLEAFDDMDLARVPWRGWIYHVPVPPEHSKVQTRDVKMDHASYDYEKIVNHAVRHGRAVLVNQSLYPFDPLKPMYERVRAMCAYVHSQAFNSPTVFLDGDAFVNTDLTKLFETIDDIAVTYRTDPQLMPINEGVIFAKPGEGTKSFFRAYLATYQHLANLPKIIDYYGDIKRWRGGQLSLNALTCPQGMPSEMDRTEIAGCTVQYLPCFTWNFSPDGPQTKEDLDSKAILHLKGDRKKLIEQVIQYQRNRTF